MSAPLADPQSIQDENDLSIARQYFGPAIAAYWHLLEPAFTYVRLAANDTLLDQGRFGDSFYIVLEGHLRVVDKDTGSILNHKDPGDGVGEIALLTGERRTATVFALTETRLVSLSRQTIEAIAGQSPEAGQTIREVLKDRVNQTRLKHVLFMNNIFKDLDEAILTNLLAELDLISVASGDLIIRAGEPSDSLYIVIDGRLRVVGQSVGGEPTYVVDICHGHTVGETGLISGQTRNATVFALRDSLLARLTLTSFRKLLNKNPETIISQFLAPFITRLSSQKPATISKTAPVTTITIIPVSPDVPISEFTLKLTDSVSQLGKVKYLDSHQCATQLGIENITELVESDPKNEAFIFWLNNQEATHDYVVYQADSEFSQWTDRCVRQADIVLLVGQAGSPPELSQIEYRLNDEPRIRQISQCLILLQDDKAALPTGTAQWLAPRNVRSYYHVRMGETADYLRLGRMITGQGVGLVLSGGGSRTLAHIGVIQALEESGVPIDAVGAVSGGAIVAGLWAMGLDITQIVNRSRQATARVDYTLPLHALSRGRNWTNAMRQLFGDILIEDLWQHYFCISTNLTHATLQLHQSESLMHAVRASTAIPGILPPVFHKGDVLVDGGLINNLPADLMKELPDIGHIIAIDVGNADPPGKIQPFDYSASGWNSLWKRLSPWAADPAMPAISEILLRSISITNNLTAKEMKRIVDLHLEPPVQTFGLLDFAKIDQLVAIGYEYALPKIAIWQSDP